MLKSKRDVDHHVKELMSKIKNENDRKSRGYSIARLYRGINEYESARKYVSEFISLRPKSSEAHRLLGEIYEGLRLKDKAIIAYKTSYEIADAQKDLVLKICELYSDLEVDNSVLVYWFEEAERLFPHDENVVKLREKLIINKASNSKEDLEKLYLDELKLYPNSLGIHLKLLKLYHQWSEEDKCKLEDAFFLILCVEARRPFPHSCEWYHCIVDIFEMYEKWKKPQKPKLFEEVFLSALECYLRLSLVSCFGSPLTASCSVKEGIAIFQKFDNRLNSAFSFIKKESLTGQYMIQQYYFNLAILLMVFSKTEPVPLRDYFIGALLLRSCGVSRKAEKHAGSSDIESIKGFWSNIGCHHFSQAGHILINLASQNGGVEKFMQKIAEYCGSLEIKKLIHDLFFASSSLGNNTVFLNDEKFGCKSQAFVKKESLLQCDQALTVFCNTDLRELVWLFMQYSNSGLELKPKFSFFNFHIFQSIPFSSTATTNAPETLCHLDLVAFIAAVAFTVKANDDAYKTKLVTPTGLCTNLCSGEQQEWWNAAVALSTSFSSSSGHGSRMRLTLQNGLEVIRLAGYQFLALVLTVHLARCFTAWVSEAEKYGNSASEIDSIRERTAHYWRKVLNQCCKLNKLSLQSTVQSRMFTLPRMEYNDTEKNEIEEEGVLFLAKYLSSNGRQDEAIQMLKALKTPDSTFKIAMLYKELAVSEHSLQKEGSSTINTDRYIDFLTSSRDNLYLTLDRLKMTGKNSDLNLQLSEELASVERSLASVSINDPDQDALRESDRLPRFQPCLELSNGNAFPFNIHSQLSSTPVRAQDSCILRQEAKPSPERLDAQVRHLTKIQQNMVQSIEEHNAALRAQNEALLHTCQTMTNEFKQNVSFYKTFIDQKLAIDSQERISSKQLDAQVRRLSEIQQTTIRNIEERNSELRSQNEALLSACQTMTAEFKQNAAFYKSFIEQKIAVGNSDAVMEKLRECQNSIQAIQAEVHSVAAEVAILRSGKAVKLDPFQLPNVANSAETSLPLNINNPMQNVYSNYMGLYGQPAVPSPLVAPTAIFSNCQPPFLPPTTIPDQRYLPPSSIKGGTPCLAPSVFTAVRNQSGITVLDAPSSPQVPCMGSSSNLKIMQSKGSSSVSGLVPPHSFQIPLSSFITVTTTSGIQAALNQDALFMPEKFPLGPQSVTHSPGVANVSRNPPVGADISGSSVEVSPRKNESLSHSDQFLEEEQDPYPDYKPVIPLPATVDVLTGEEEEVVLFEERAKLFRFFNKEWKERGVGPIKILHNTKRDTCRVLMRRDQTLKVCCNHLILSAIELSAMKDNDKAWLWAAQDFADEKLKTEKFCCRFKTFEIARAFKVAFNRGRDIARNAEKVINVDSSQQCATGKPLADLFKPEVGSWSCDVCLLVNKKENKTCVACHAPNKMALISSPDVSQVSFGPSGTVTISVAKAPTPSLFDSGSLSDGKFKLEGITFKTTPTLISNVSLGEKVATSDIRTEPKKESIFSNFTFNPNVDSVDSTSDATKPSFSFLPKHSSNDSFPSATLSGVKICSPETRSSQNKGFVNKPSPDTPAEDVSKDDVEEYEPQVHFQPAIPMPELVEVKTGEEDEDILFSEKAKLFRYDGGTKEWKERGIGEIKILQNQRTSRVRILMRREQTHKICANHFVTPEMKLAPMANSDRACVWAANDYADEEMKAEQFAVKFKTEVMVKKFKEAFKGAQNSISSSSSAPVKQEAHMTFDQKGLHKTIKIPLLGWECPTCLITNQELVQFCLACSTAKPGAKSETTGGTQFSTLVSKANTITFPFGTTSTAKPETKFTFGFPPTTTSPFSKKVEPPTTTSTDGSSFTFGSRGSYEFSFSGAKPIKSPRSRDASVCESEDDPAEEEEDNLYFMPAVPLPNKVDVITGEEDEQELFSHRAKLFRLYAGEWKERGIGIFKILQHLQLKKIRLLMRREQVLKISLNHYLTKEMNFRMKDNRTFYWVAHDFADDVPSLQTFAIRFKTPEIASSFMAVIMTYQGNSQASFTTPEKTGLFGSDSQTPTPNMSSPKAGTGFEIFGGSTSATPSPSSSFSFGNRFSPQVTKPFAKDEVDIIYEKKAPAELVEKARKLKLPDNFYLYEYAAPCVGCIGCEPEDRIMPFSQVPTSTDNVSTPATVFSGKTSTFGGSGNLFGSNAREASKSIFASKPSLSVFGNTAPTQDKLSLFMSAPDTVSFGDIAKNEACAFKDASKGSKSEAWVSKPLFGKAALDKSREKDESTEDYDPHYEPVIPMPELIEIKTGEEGWQELFSQRAKVYRYDPSSKQWKERGIGEFKIQFEPQLKKYRLLQRREQVHKLSCNHYLTCNMELEPMLSSEVAWCWIANDYSEGQAGELLKLAVKFKTKAIADNFKEVFESCKQQLASYGGGAQPVEKAIEEEESGDQEGEDVDEEGEEEEEGDDEEGEEEEEGDDEDEEGKYDEEEDVEDEEEGDDEEGEDVEDEEEGDDEEGEDEEDEEKYVEDELASVLMEPTPCSFTTSDSSSKWRTVACGLLSIYHDGKSSGVKILVEDNDSNTLAHSVIVEESEMTSKGFWDVSWNAQDELSPYVMMNTYLVEFSDVKDFQKFEQIFREAKTALNIVKNTGAGP